jgi:peptidoglycan/LPS O-acetylase OafA/YrhL
MLRYFSHTARADRPPIGPSHAHSRPPDHRTEIRGRAIGSNDRDVGSAGMYPGLDSLRAFAAISVVVYHVIELFAWKDFPSHNFIAQWFRVGGFGVDLFFVISGLVITLSLARLHEGDPVGYRSTYMGRRLWRIVPLYYLTCAVFVLLVNPALMSVPHLPLKLLSYLTFTHNLSTRTLGLINGVSWTLGVEMQFYLLLLVAFPLLRRMRSFSVLLLVVPVSWVWRAASFYLLNGQTQSGTNMTWFATMQLPGSLDEFGFGIALGLMFARDKDTRVLRFLRATRWAWVLAAVLAMSLTWSIYQGNKVYWPYPGMVTFWRTLFGASLALVVVAACAVDDAWFLSLTAPLRYLGTISYGIYLWHLSILLLVRPFLMHSPSAGCAAILVLTIILAAASWHLFERPILRRCAPTSRIRRDSPGPGLSLSHSALHEAGVRLNGTHPVGVRPAIARAQSPSRPLGSESSELSE